MGLLRFSFPLAPHIGDIPSVTGVLQYPHRSNYP